MSKKPSDILDDLMDAFFEAEAELEAVFGMAAVDYIGSIPVKNLPYFETADCDYYFEQFQKAYNDIHSLRGQVKQEESS